MTTNVPSDLQRPLSTCGQELFHARVLQVCVGYIALDKHLIANHNGEHQKVCDELKMIHELLCQVDQEPEFISRARLIEICQTYQVAVENLIGTFDLKTRLQLIIAVICLVFGAVSLMVDLEHGFGTTSIVGPLCLILAAYLRHETKQKLDSIFHYAYGLQAQMKRDLNLAINVIEDDMNPHH